MKKPIIFCDFDGTVTNNDNIISIMKKFAPPGWSSIKDQVLAQTISIEEGVGKMFSLLSSDLKEPIIDYLKNTASIRKGFQDFVQFAHESDIPFYIVSGGIDFFVHRLLEPFWPIKEIYCNEADFGGEMIKIHWPYSCDSQCQNGCGCCKTSIIRKLTNENHFKIVIGDSITDLEAANQADFVLARDFLAEKCKELNLDYHPFETFDDCRIILEKELEVKIG